MKLFDSHEVVGGHGRLDIDKIRVRMATHVSKMLGCPVEHLLYSIGRSVPMLDESGTLKSMDIQVMYAIYEGHHPIGWKKFR